MNIEKGVSSSTYCEFLHGKHLAHDLAQRLFLNSYTLFVLLCCICSSFHICISPSHRNDFVVSLRAVLYHSRLFCSPNCNIHLALCWFLLQAKCTILDGFLIKMFETSIWLNKNHAYSSYLKMTPVQMLCPPLTVSEREDGGKEGGNLPTPRNAACQEAEF